MFCYKRIIDVSPACTPRGAPNRNITLSDLIKAMGFKDRQNFNNGCPKSRFWSIGIWAPNG
jgi:hypothetical protein